MLYSPDWTNTWFSFILQTVNLFRHSTLTEQGLYLTLLVGILCLSLICYSLLCVLSGFAIPLTGKRAGCFALISLLMSCECYCFVDLPRGAAGWSAVCVCGIS